MMRAIAHVGRPVALVRGAIALLGGAIALVRLAAQRQIIADPVPFVRRHPGHCTREKGREDRGRVKTAARPSWRPAISRWRPNRASSRVCAVPRTSTPSFSPSWRGVVLVAGAETTRARVAVSVEALGVLAMFGASAVYHRFSWPPAQSRELPRLDHAMIYLLIAGTYAVRDAGAFRRRPDRGARRRLDGRTRRDRACVRLAPKRCGGETSTVSLVLSGDTSSSTRGRSPRRWRTRCAGSRVAG